MDIGDGHASFLRARDPSILAWNRPQLNPSIKMDLDSKLIEDTILSEDKNTEHLKVYLRVKPSNDLQELYDISNNILVCRVPSGSQALRNLQDGSKLEKKYSFTKIYGPETDQPEFFNDCMKEKVLEFINGKNCTIFTYGTSGSGKTYTILGTANHPGIIPRSLEYMFRTLPPIGDVPQVKPTASGDVTMLDQVARKNERTIRKNLLNVSSTLMEKSLHIQTYKAMQQRLSTEPTAIIIEDTDVSLGIWVSFAEVYNEYVYDLLTPDPARGKQRPKLRLAQDNKGNTYIKDLSSISVSSGLEAYEILQYGMHNLNYAATSVNSHSSRSHCIFTIKLVQMSNKEAQISHFNFCDLAGSERVKNTRNVGDRLKESNNINTSLHVLGRCIKSIRESQKCNDSRLVPFRDSKLTRLFQRALSGQESIAMIVNINANRDMFDESQHVLNFSAIAKNISMQREVKPVKVEINKRFSHYIQSRSTALPSISEHEQSEVDILREQVQSLCLELESQKYMWVEKERAIRHELVNTLTSRNQELADKWAKRMNEQKQSLIDMYECKIEEIQDYYEKKSERDAKRARVSVIELDDTKDDEIEDLKDDIKNKTEELVKMRETFAEVQTKNSSLQAEITQMYFKFSIQEKELKESMTKNKELQTKILDLTENKLELERVLNDAEIEYKQIEKEKKELELELEEKTCEVFNLQKEVADLNAQLSTNVAEQVEHIEYVEELEEKLNGVEQSA